MPEEKKKEQTQPEKAGEDKGDKYFLVIVGDDSPTVVECESMEGFASAVSEHVLEAENPLYAFGFKGKRIQISDPSPICSVEVAGEKQDVGGGGRNVDSSGRITPLRRSRQ